MTLTKEFMEAVGLGDKTLVRIMLKDIMLVDPSMKTFEEMSEFIEKNKHRYQMNRIFINNYLYSIEYKKLIKIY